jgi:hypothetical protein
MSLHFSKEKESWVITMFPSDAGVWANPYEIERDGWAAIVKAHPTLATDSVHHQFSCHVLGRAALFVQGDLSMDCELTRPDDPKWLSRVWERSTNNGAGACSW